MINSIRSIFVLVVFAVVMAACSSNAGASASDAPSPSQPASPSVEPSVAPSEEPVAEERQVDGTITVYPGAVSGPGGTIADAIANGPDLEMPSLVNGVLFRDTDGTIYLATSVGDANVPTFDSPMLEVLNTEIAGYNWDMANAELLGLEEANGIVFQRDTQVLGTIDLP